MKRVSKKTKEKAAILNDRILQCLLLLLLLLIEIDLISVTTYHGTCAYNT